MGWGVGEVSFLAPGHLPPPSPAPPITSTLSRTRKNISPFPRIPPVNRWLQPQAPQQQITRLPPSITTSTVRRITTIRFPHSRRIRRNSLNNSRIRLEWRRQRRLLQQLRWWVYWIIWDSMG